MGPIRRASVGHWLLSLAFVAPLVGCPRRDQPIPPLPTVDQPGSGKPRIYELAVRYFGNVRGTNVTGGSAEVNGVGTFDDVNDAALASLASLGITHVWLTGALDQATLTDHSDVGKPASNANIVKGLAGSLYAVRDLFDVSPDLAQSPSGRVAAFDALISRIHAHGLKALLDLPVNEVSRDYRSLVSPANSFGATDLGTAFFSSDDFFYLVSPPGQALSLPRIPWWQAPGWTGSYAPEDGTPGHVPKATGNDVTSPDPAPGDDWDGIKVNLGYNFVDGTEHFTPQPASWGKLDLAVAHWQAHSVDGFVTQGTRYVPWPFWRFLIGAARARGPALFIGDGLGGVQPPTTDTGGSDLVSAGFDGLFDPGTLGTLRGGVCGATGSGGLNDLGGLTDDNYTQHLVRYGEQQAEPRLASPIVPGDAVNSGLGGAKVGLAATALLWLQSSGPILLFNGQEVGEPGAGVEGYSLEDGRTTIYDYWTMPEFAKWADLLAYDGALLSQPQAALRAGYGTLLALCGVPAFASGAYYGIQFANQGNAAYGNSGHDLLAYLRYTADGSGRYLVVGNLSASREYDPALVIPAEALRFMNMSADATSYTLSDQLGSGAKVKTDGSTLQISGVGLALQPATTYAFEVTSP